MSNKNDNTESVYRDGFEVTANYWGAAPSEELLAEEKPMTETPNQELDKKRAETNEELIAALRSTMSGGC